MSRSVLHFLSVARADEVFDKRNEWLGGNYSVNCFGVEVSAWVKQALFFACCGPWFARRASEVESKASDDGSLYVGKGLRDRCLWKVALDEGATLWAAISSGFVLSLDAKEAECKGRSFHS